MIGGGSGQLAVVRRHLAVVSRPTSDFRPPPSGQTHLKCPFFKGFAHRQAEMWVPFPC